jgi:ribosome recycling factor
MNCPTLTGEKVDLKKIRGDAKAELRKKYKEKYGIDDEVLAG